MKGLRKQLFEEYVDFQLEKQGKKSNLGVWLGWHEQVDPYTPEIEAFIDWLETRGWDGSEIKKVFFPKEEE